ncbi:MAG: type II secretion system protein GspG [Planctomycetes bacterium]|nr:type II secretion system protein GspG [Planctomycetota bacterium]
MRQRKKNIGFTLIELMVVIVILGIIGTTAFVFVFDKPDEAKWSRAQSEMMELGKAVNMYALANDGDYPESLSELTNSYPNGVPKDPFTKSEYEYEIFDDDFNITCLGKDGAEGGEKPADRDITINKAGIISDNEG